MAELCSLLAVAGLMKSPLLIPAYATAAAVWSMKRLYARRFSISLLDDLAPITLGACFGTLTVLLLGVGMAHTGLRAPLAAAAAMSGTVLGTRAVGYALILEQRRRRRLNYPMLIVGGGAVAVSLARRLQDHPEYGVRPIGLVGRRAVSGSAALPVLGDLEDLPDLVRRRGIRDIIIAHGALPAWKLVTVIRSCGRLDVEVHVVPRLFEMQPLVGGGDHIWGMPLVRLHRRAHRAYSWRLKRVLDVLCAATALVLLSPLLVATALAVRLELGRDIFFEQVRVGLDGRPVKLRKFRSMRPLPSGMSNPWTVVSDERVGPVGRFIRRYSLDELPQLMNVLVGDMSLVGPRPERPEYVERFRAEVPCYGDRHRVPAGLTGLAAVNGLRGDTSISDRAYFDNFYIENWSLALDLKILCLTVGAVLKGTGR